MRRSPLPDPARTADLIRRRCPLKPAVGIVLGSGFGGLGDAVLPNAEFAFRDLPGFPIGKVPGHPQRLLLGTWHGAPLAILQGRAHFYEGFDLDEVTFPIRVLAALNVPLLLVTNAAGGLNPQFKPGDFMIIRDHLNGLGHNPLRGPNIPGRTRFVDLTQAYDPQLRRALQAAAKAVRAPCHSGVYYAVSGPSFETPAEIRAFRRLGADAVGMSTVPEVIVARQCGLRVAGLSCITNQAAGLGRKGQTLGHEEVLRVARDRETLATLFVGEFVRRVG